MSINIVNDCFIERLHLSEEEIKEIKKDIKTLDDLLSVNFIKDRTQSEYFDRFVIHRIKCPPNYDIVKITLVEEYASGRYNGSCLVCTLEADEEGEKVLSQLHNEFIELKMKR